MNAPLLSLALLSATPVVVQKMLFASQNDDQSAVKTVAAELAIVNAAAAYGNLTLPTDINGVKVKWSSENKKLLTATGAVTRLRDQWETVDYCIGAKAGINESEAPLVFKSNPGDVNGNYYYMWMERWIPNKTYVALRTKSLEKPLWEVVPVHFPDPLPKHGAILPITAAEAKALAINQYLCLHLPYHNGRPNHMMRK